MRFLENVHIEFTLPIEDDENRHRRLDLNAMLGAPIEGTAFLDIPTRYPYSLSLERRVRTAPLVVSNFEPEYTYLSVVSGIAYISLDEIKELKKDPYRFCVENGLIESNEETESEDDSDGKEEDEHDIHKEIPQS